MTLFHNLNKENEKEVIIPSIDGHRMAVSEYNFYHY